MKNLLRHPLHFITLLIIFSTTSSAQNASRINFIGLNPSVTVEPFYTKGELDINILPIVYQRPLGKRVDIRLTSILNLGIRNEGNSISHFGIETAVPVFFKAKESKKESSEGFFVAPIVSTARDRIEAHDNLGLWIEPGYHFLFDNDFALSCGIQLGGTYFAYDDGQTNWGNHFGVKIIFGKWF